MLKGFPMGLMILLIAGLVATASIMTFYVKIEGSNQIDQLWEVKDNSTGTYSAYSDAEEAIITFDTSDLVGGDSVSWNFTLRLNANADLGKTMYFVVTDFIDDGVNVTILKDGVETADYAFAPGDEIEFQFKLDVDVYTFADTYICTVVMGA